ncbi:type VII secretion system ESX-1 transmembrane protein B [Nocardioides albertanoniae]|uniref:Type VII secretion system ESX-1 transmembrane protein B n=1 Tax=Nocardioides albertanoniae TaxID=1175486 RepID=A0A543ADQ4_9ACTN|nr:type VII secretion protein EccB [Nocardioides albertanoniae]TQL70717.1 type VII secretion system ESX-1 transmembrane protein B [Nocardioides albertanoniae]
MASKKDLVEAHAFSRRRLVSAFLSGAPGGREVEPARPGRSVFGGLVLAVLLIAGGGVAHFLSPKAATGWADQPGLIVTKGGARYVVTGPEKERELYPVVNLASAQLILGLDLEKKSKVIDQEEIDKEFPKGTIGISGAGVPEELPRKSDFINSGWTTCTANGSGTFLNISAKPDVHEAAGAGFMVQSEEGTYLIAESQDLDGYTQAYSYKIDDDAETYADGAFSGPVSTPTVPQAWVNLFPAGAPLSGESFGSAFTKAGQTVEGEDYPIGTKGNYQAKNYLMTESGWIRLEAFASEVYDVAFGSKVNPQSLDSQPNIHGDRLESSTFWPRETLTPATGPACAKLEAGKKTTVRLGTEPGADAWPTTEPPEATDLTSARVDPGKGAFVFASNGEDLDKKSATPFLVDARGSANTVDGPVTVDRLGLTSDSGTLIPGTWLRMLPSGAALSTEMALCPPGSGKVEESKCVAE